MAAPSTAGLVLKSVKSIAVRFCPFESNVRSAREFLEAINSKKVRSTNANCQISVDVRHDKSEPQVDVSFVDGERLLMKTANVTTKEMLSALTSKCASKDRQAKDGAKK
ncbi:39S ribosomal protein L53, mitochondrial [Spea bombifrons]|uniref:39S ribosomal protein L53, mitochondrial n=1 Tax=Spea bombifrons TaxID=233779 RepID=UPI002349D8CC|nr:39S ribosomal protein L53, mitochondrial [Spea bombifrons]